MVLKKFGSEKGHLVDYFGLLNDEIMEIIIRYAISFCLKNKLSILSFLSNYITAGKSVLEMHEKLGFIPMQKDTHFGIRLLQMNDEESITDKNRWFVNMCDSDVY